MYQRSENPLGAMKIVEKFEKSDISSVIQYFLNVERVCNDYVENGANHITIPENEFYTNLSPFQVLSEPRKICPRTKLNWTDKFLVTSDVLQQGWCRSFLNYIDWVSHIPELHQLTIDDQIRLVMDRGTSCMDILAGYRAFQNNVHYVKGIPFSGGAYFPRDDSQNKLIDPGFNPMLKEYAISIYDEITIPAKELNLSSTEYALLRVITFLTPGRNFYFQMFNFILHF
uniref:NR LBD domain-containing protein n=1 Tax=Panagrolaimus sp. PS1159 TaxID=55785 RepID=A0AC35GC45_9BILA